MKTYSGGLVGLTFRYPAHYFLEEKTIGNAERWHYAVVLTEDTEENKQVREGNAPGREGPTAITIDSFQNDIDRMSLLDWVRGTSFSNFKLSDGTYRSESISGTSAVRYDWDGLYRGDSIALSQGDAIYLIQVTYLTPDDQIRKDFSEILKTLEFTK